MSARGLDIGAASSLRGCAQVVGRGKRACGGWAVKALGQERHCSKRRASGSPWGCLARAFLTLPPVPGERDETADYIGGEARRTREMPERRVVVLFLAAADRLGDRFAARQYPAARTRRPAELVLDHAQSAGRDPLAVLQLAQGPVGHAGRLSKRTPVPHVQFDPARYDVIGQPPPVLTGHEPIPPPKEAEGFSSYRTTVTSDLHISSDAILLRYFASSLCRSLHHDRDITSDTFPKTGFWVRLTGDRRTTWQAAQQADPGLESHGRHRQVQR